MSIGEFWEPPLDAIATSLANMGLTGDGITRAITRAASRNVLPRPDVLAAIAGGAAGLGGLSGYLGARRGRGGRGAFRGAAKGLGAGLGFGLLTPAAAGLGGVGGAVAGSALGGMAGSGVAALLNRLGSKGPVISPGAAASIGSLFGAAPLGAAGTVLGAFAPGYAGYKLTERALNRSDYDREKQSADAGIPELDVPESLTERALGGWRRPTVDFTDRLNPPENWSSTHKDKLDRVVMDVPGFNAWRGEAIEDHLNARLLGDALRASEASKSRSRDYADWLAAVERASPGGLLSGGRRRVNRAIGRRLKVEDEMDREYADARRRADEVWTRKALESLAGGNLEPSDDVNSAGWRVPTNLMDFQNKPRSFKQLMGVVGDKKRGPVKRAAAIIGVGAPRASLTRVFEGSLPGPGHELAMPEGFADRVFRGWMAPNVDRFANETSVARKADEDWVREAINSYNKGGETWAADLMNRRAELLREKSDRQRELRRAGADAWLNDARALSDDRRKVNRVANRFLDKWRTLDSASVNDDRAVNREFVNRLLASRVHFERANRGDSWEDSPELLRALLMSGREDLVKQPPPKMRKKAVVDDGSVAIYNSDPSPIELDTPSTPVVDGMMGVGRRGAGRAEAAFNAAETLPWSGLMDIDSIVGPSLRRSRLDAGDHGEWREQLLKFYREQATSRGMARDYANRAGTAAWLAAVDAAGVGDEKQVADAINRRATVEMAHLISDSYRDRAAATRFADAGIAARRKFLAGDPGRDWEASPELAEALEAVQGHDDWKREFRDFTNPEGEKEAMTTLAGPLADLDGEDGITMSPNVNPLTTALVVGGNRRGDGGWASGQAVRTGVGAAAGYAMAPEGHRDVGAARGAVYGYGVPMAANIGGGIGGLGGLGLGGLLGVLLARKYGLSKPNDVALAAAAGAIPAGLLGALGGQATGGYLGYKAIGRLLGKPPWDKSEDKAGGSADEKQATDFTIRDAPLLGGLTGLSGLKGMQFANRLFDKAYPEPDADADGYEVAKEALVRVRGRRRGD